jgi:hypothetical protein
LITEPTPAIPLALLPTVFGDPSAKVTDYLSVTEQGTVLLGKYKCFLVF